MKSLSPFLPLLLFLSPPPPTLSCRYPFTGSRPKTSTSEPHTPLLIFPIITIEVQLWEIKCKLTLDLSCHMCCSLAEGPCVPCQYSSISARLSTHLHNLYVSGGQAFCGASLAQICFGHATSTCPSCSDSQQMWFKLFPTTCNITPNTHSCSLLNVRDAGVF